MENQDVITAVNAALERDSGVNLHAFPIHLDFRNGILTMEGELADIIAKKKTLVIGAATPGVDHIVDRIRVAPAERMQDADIRVRVCNALLAENLLGTCSIKAVVKGSIETISEPEIGKDGDIVVEVTDGVVVLNGAVMSLSHKRIAGAMAWWVPGVRDVVNGLDLSPDERDNDSEVVDAVRLVLEKDPFVNVSQIRVSCSNYTVTLDGLVKNQDESRIAEADTWFVFGVNNVVNRLQVEE